MRRFFPFVLPGVAIAALGGARAAAADETPWHVGAVRTPVMASASPDAATPVTIAIVDDGLNTDHPELSGLLWRNPQEIVGNGIDDDGNGYVDDVHGWDVADGDGDVRAPASRIDEYFHATFVAGVIARTVRQALGTRAERLVRIVPVKSLSDEANTPALQSAFDGIRYALDIDADIVLTPWAVATMSGDERRLLERARSEGRLVIASAGNELVERTRYPAAHEATLAVAASNRVGEPMEGSNHGPFVDLSAPGEDIVSTGYAAGSRRTESGTSHAAALVAAAAALVKIANRDLTQREVAACLVNHTDELAYRKTSQRGKFGSGSLNVKEAIVCESLGSPAPGRPVDRSTGYLVLDGSTKDVTWPYELTGRYEGMRLTPFSTGRVSADGVVSVERRSGETTSFELEERGRGTVVPGTPASVRFSSDGELPAGRTLLAYRMLSIDFTTEFCSGTTLVDTETVIDDGSGDERYAHHSDCRWLIVAPEDQRARIEVLELDTEPGVDKLHFFDGEGTHDTLIGVLSGDRRPPAFRSWHDRLLLWFVTDGENEFPGWKLRVSFVDAPPD